MARESLEDFLSFMREKPRTLGWDAIVAYDRNKANDLLVQEYIDRFESTAYFETLTFAVPITQGWQVSEGQRLDKPRLKFEDAELGNSTADLSMHIVGGRQFHVGFDLNGGYRFNSIKLADALNGPVLHVRVRLGNSPGVIEPVQNGEAKVVIDLSNPTWEFYLTFSDYPEENLVGGARYKEIFSNWPDEKKKLTLNTLKVAPDEFVQPASFLIRTHAEPNATGGEGAVLLFVTMQGGENGSLPATDEDFHYLLPDGETPYSTNVIFSQKYFVTRLVAKWFAGLNSANADSPFEFKISGDGDGRQTFIQGIEATRGVFKAPRYTTDQSARPYLDYQNGFNLPFAPDPVFGVGTFLAKQSQLSEELELAWSGDNNTFVEAGTNTGQGWYAGESDFGWTGTATFRFGLDDQNQCRMQFLGYAMLCRLGVRSDWYDYAKDYPAMYEVITETNRVGGEKVKEAVTGAIDSFAGATNDLNLFLIHGLLFRGGAEVIQPDEAHLPGDVVLPGYLAPSRTALKLNATEVTIGAGSFYQFTAEPSSGVTWAVSNLPDEEGDCGSIDGNGKYTPMAASTIPHAQKVVIVTATSGEHISRALVTVIKRSIALDPVIMTAQQLATKDNVYKVSGASLQGSNLQWRMSENAIGSIQTDPDPLPDVQDGRLYVVPKKSSAATMAFDERYGKLMPVPSEQWQARRAAGCKFSAVDLSDLMAFEQIIVEGGNDSQTIDVLLPLRNETHWFTYQPMADGAVQLEFWTDTQDGHYQVPPEDADWFLVRGNGTLELGLYTPAADGSDSYAVVAAYEQGARGYWWTYAILPMPYLDVAPIIENGASS
ncbi:hypothetical protein [Pseudomonas putida]|uniref:hypothetical protein n=1 Tax=Pseudomonas putida TaxID=303 RepID=UPI001F517FE4|nr:hypothetical protein [Pseudomonas putida]MCI0910844.1 hypothetical protein [Pseudomonas putida]